MIILIKVPILGLEVVLVIGLLLKRVSEIGFILFLFSALFFVFISFLKTELRIPHLPYNLFYLLFIPFIFQYETILYFTSLLVIFHLIFISIYHFILFMKIW